MDPKEIDETVSDLMAMQTATFLSIAQALFAKGYISPAELKTQVDHFVNISGDFPRQSGYLKILSGMLTDPKPRPDMRQMLSVIRGGKDSSETNQS